MADRSTRNGNPAGALRLVAALGGVLALVAGGCRTPLDLSALKPNPDDEIARMTSIEGIRGPLERVLNSSESGEAGGSLAPAAGRSEYEAARRLFEERQYKAAERAAKTIAKRFKNSPVREDAMFLVAESQFMQGKLSWAQDSYDELRNEFPSSRYLDQSSRRLFQIAAYWLGTDDPITSDEVQPAGFDDGGRGTGPETAAEKRGGQWWDLSRTIPFYPNMWDRTRPVFDTEGRALEALKSVWLKDPTGPLADDALMLTAGHHLQKGNYIEADHIYTILREEYPKGQHAEHAWVLGSHVKLASYQGAEYDGKSLEAARELKKSTLKLYPHHPERVRLREELERIVEAKAEQDWAMVQYWKRRGKPKAMAVYCREILRRYPESAFADQARQLLAELEPESAPARVPVSPRHSPSQPELVPPPSSRTTGAGEAPGRASIDHYDMDEYRSGRARVW